MTRVIVTYPATAGAKFDLDYYMSKHMPMVSQKLTPHGLTGWAKRRCRVDGHIVPIMLGTKMIVQLCSYVFV